MLCANVFVVESLGLLIGQLHDFPRPIGESLKHPPFSQSKGQFCWPLFKITQARMRVTRLHLPWQRSRTQSPKYVHQSIYRRLAAWNDQAVESESIPVASGPFPSNRA